jgi:hypothetical protein
LLVLGLLSSLPALEASFLPVVIEDSPLARWPIIGVKNTGAKRPCAIHSLLAKGLPLTSAP